MTAMKHTPECDAGYAKAQAAIEAYCERWPDHCQDCNGAGGHTTRYDPSPPGVALSPGWMYDWDPCPECLGRMTNFLDYCTCGHRRLDHARDGDRLCSECENCVGYWHDHDHDSDDMGPAPLCPRCGLAAIVLRDEDACDVASCRACGWDEKKSDACPEPWECWGCFEEEEALS